jgi:DNA-binding winged helix-turn-helix (wHTH) protein
VNSARTAIGDDGEQQRLIRTLPRKGVRFVGEVREQSDLPAPSEAAMMPNAAPICAIAELSPAMPG